MRGLAMSGVQADGNDVEPVVVEEFRISVAETYDGIVRPQDTSAYTIFAQAEDRTGYARGTLAPKYGMSAVVPPMDPRPLRTMHDMGMGTMGGMKMSGANMPGMEMGGVSGTNMEKMPAMDMGNPPEYVKRARMIGPNAPGQPGPRTSSEFTEPDMGDMKAPISKNLRPNLGPQLAGIAQLPTERLSTTAQPVP